MCGIGGILFSLDDPAKLKVKIGLIAAAQRHRGPDHQSTLIVGKHAFCHQRLSLVDTPGGQQPLWDNTGRYLIVYNGELYNYLELKRELQDYYPFTTSSDTEVVLAAYLHWKEECFKRFNGMYAFLIWDTITATGLAGRDPLGVKPFVYHWDGMTFTFSSELKALLKVIPKPAIDEGMLAEYVMAPYFSGNGQDAIFKGVHYLPPGTLMHITNQGPTLKTYYQFNWWPSLLDAETLIERLNEALLKSVELTAGGPLPLGLFLSGGVDSSLLAALAVRYAKAPLFAFTIAFQKHGELSFDQATIVNSDDLPFAEEVAAQFKLPWHQVEAQRNPLADHLMTLSQSNDRIPAWEQELTQVSLARAAAKRVKAVMEGWPVLFGPKREGISAALSTHLDDGFYKETFWIER